MLYPKFKPAADPDKLVRRVLDFFYNADRERLENSSQTELELNYLAPHISYQGSPVETIELLSSITQNGDLYLFGGMLRDLALFGKKGFTSDVDMVVGDNWELMLPYIVALGAEKNKFGGYRFKVGDLYFDIWNAAETWAFKSGFVRYSGISSLLDTTVLNWDAILMNWRTQRLLYKPNYFSDINNRFMDLVLLQNPNEVGMGIRVMRHILLKDAQYISYEVVNFLFKFTNKFQFDDIHKGEKASFGRCVIDEKFFEVFKDANFRVNEIVPNEDTESTKAFVGSMYNTSLFTVGDRASESGRPSSST